MRRRFSSFGIPARSGLFWGMALAGLLLLPSDYRAGSETAHAHSLVQLWADAADGIVHHHQSGTSHRVQEGTMSWFDPAAAGESAQPSGIGIGIGNERPDVAEQQESAPAASGVHLLLAAATAILFIRTRHGPVAGPVRCLAGQSPRVLLPPPRRTPAAA